MILEFSIENYLSIKDKQTFSFEIANKKNDDLRHVVEMKDKTKILKMACIYGANASGKTNLLTGLSFFMDFITNSFDQLKPNEEIPVDSFRFVKDFDIKKPSSFEIIFYHEEHKYIYNISLNKERIISESLYWVKTSQRKRIYDRNNLGEIIWSQDVKGAKKQVEVFLSKNTSLLFICAKLNIPKITDVFNTLESLQLPMVSSGCGNIMAASLELLATDEKIKKDTLKLLSLSYFNNIKDLEIESNDISEQLKRSLQAEAFESINGDNKKNLVWDANVIHEFGENEYKLPLRMESSGTIRFIELTLPLIHLINSSKILIVDEIESSLHQELLEYFIDIFLTKTESSQMLMSTHNLDLMDSSLFRDDEIWFAIKNDLGETRYNCVSDYSDIRKKASRKKLYEANRFGAKPIMQPISQMEF